MAVQRAEVLDSAFARERAVMVSRHLRARGIEGPLLLAAMSAVPREAFVPEHLQEFSYEDSALPIEAGQTISQPYIVARMLELAEIKPGDKVLEVGAGSGYAAAVMSRMANKVFAIERHEELARLARARLRRLGYENVETVIADGTKGLPEEAPFQAIVVSAGGPHVPEALKQQLAAGGRLIIPVGEFGYQTLMRVRRTGEHSFEEEDFGAVAFVPLIGEEGWAEPERERIKEAPVDAEPTGFAAGLLLPAKRALTIHNRLSRLMAETAEPFGDLHELCI
jgi:protein-L-isoaspartate(D-aspartate) O-methyltransferase